MIESSAPFITRVKSLLKQKQPALLAIGEEYEELWEMAKLLTAQGFRKHHAGTLTDVLDVDLVAAMMGREDLRDNFLDLARRILCVFETNQKRELEESLRKYLIAPLGEPSAFTSRELSALLGVHVNLGSTVDSEDLENFGAALVRKFRKYRFSKRILVATTESPGIGTLDHEPAIWSNDFMDVQLSVVLAAKRLHVRDFEPPKQFSFGKVYARIFGWYSAAAGKLLVRRFKHLIRALLWAVADLEAPAVQRGKFHNLPILSTDLLAHQVFIINFVELCFKPIKVKDETTARLRNAVHLLVEASSQVHDSIALVLYCSAIEALLSRGKEGVTKNLSEDVAALLEPDRRMRSAAIDFVKELYHLRSRSLHGDGLQGDATQRSKARALATHVLRAVLERVDFDARIGAKPGDKGEFLRELGLARIAGDEFVGVTPSLIRKLWNANS